MKLRSLLAFLKCTPFHPQWFAFRQQRGTQLVVRRHARGLVLDIGCSNKAVAQCLTPECRYVGLDYPDTARHWYHTRPDVFGDAQRLPFADGTIDTVLLLDVLEHLPFPDKALASIVRVLRGGGHLILQVPFIYPIHDAPLDFRRWTLFGLRSSLRELGLVCEVEQYYGEPLETAALTLNIALSKTMLNCLAQRSPASLLLPMLPFAILLVNLAGWCLARIGGSDSMMPIGYLMVVRKPCPAS